MVHAWKSARIIGAIAIAMILCGGANWKQYAALGTAALRGAFGYITWQSKIPGSYVEKRIAS